MQQAPSRPVQDQATALRDGSPASAKRPGRALIGWMQSDAAIRVLNGNDSSIVATSDQAAIVRVAQTIVNDRPSDLDQVGLIHEPPADLDSHIHLLRQSGNAQMMFAEGWAVMVADLARVCAFQPIVFTDSAHERVEGIDLSDLAILAQVTLPLVGASTFPVQFDQLKQAFSIVSRNHNLRVTSVYSGPGVNAGNQQVLGFTVAMSPSFMQVVEFQGRYFLRDGYHRALELIKSGINRVPVFFRNIRSVEELCPPGMLPQSAFLGPRPPTLKDYREQDVSAGVELPSTQKLIVINALELTVLG